MENPVESVNYPRQFVAPSTGSLSRFGTGSLSHKPLVQILPIVVPIIGTVTFVENVPPSGSGRDRLAGDVEVDETYVGGLEDGLKEASRRRAWWPAIAAGARRGRTLGRTIARLSLCSQVQAVW